MGIKKSDKKLVSKKAIILAVSGVSGAGKDSVIDGLRKFPQQFSFPVACTDRPARPSDIPGETYHFLSEKEFDQVIAHDQFWEWEKVHNSRYGRKKKEFLKALNSGKIVVVNCDVLGAQKFKKMFGAVTVFVMPPSIEEAIKRVRKRGGESEEEIKKRISRYKMELAHKDKSDYVLINDDLATAQKELLKITKSLV